MLQWGLAGKEIEDSLHKRLMILDGGMGTMLQQYKLQEEDFRPASLKEHTVLLKGNNELLNLSRPEVVSDIHYAYLEAGADIIETNTFNANAVSQEDYKLSHMAREMNLAAMKVAIQARDKYFQKTGKRTFIAGSIGPTNKTASLSPKVEDPAYRAISYEELVQAYEEQAQALIDGGVDILLVETIFDTLNSKACLFAIQNIQTRMQKKLPIWISVTITDQSGRTLTGQTVEAFWNSVRHVKPLIVGMNCALGSEQMGPWLRELAWGSDCFLSCYPNAGLPNPLSPTGYDETPENFARVMRAYAEEGLLHVVGGCCGTGPKHIEALANTLTGLHPGPVKEQKVKTRLSGLMPLNISASGDKPFYLVGERTNVTGSPKFASLIKAGDFSSAVSVARQQVQNGANILDVNFDEAMLDGVASMKHFLNLLSAEPEIATIPFMIDSSRFDVLEAGLRCVQGKAVVNSISLKDGEEEFLKRARLIQQYGAAAVVMAFDEKGQAVTFHDKVSISQRAYKLLTEKVGFDPSDIIFDPNILTVATGISEHDNYAVDFIEAIREIKKTCPGALTSGGVSNLSFSFRGQNVIREALHSVFLFHAIQAGLDMAIVNAGMLEIYEQIDPRLRELCEGLVLNKPVGDLKNSEEITAELIAWAQTHSKENKQSEHSQKDSWLQLGLKERIVHALVNGIDSQIEEDTQKMYEELGQGLAVIEGPLMDGMKVVGNLFGQGKMFLPQVVKSARVMKKAVAKLEPYLLGGSATQKSQGTVVLATVKGDVHDIGKNIVGVVLACNGYRVVDLGVMVSCEAIIQSALKEKADLIGLSGLITPSLDEMVFNLKEFERRGLKVPILIGGATTSKVHTAVKMASETELPVIHVKDASLVVDVCRKLSGDARESFVAEVLSESKRVREDYLSRASEKDFISLNDARKKKALPQWSRLSELKPEKLGVQTLSIPVSVLREYIDWSPFFWTWGLKGMYPSILTKGAAQSEATKLFSDAQNMLVQIEKENWLQPKITVGVWQAHSENEDVILSENNREIERFTFLRQQREKFSSSGQFLCLADFVSSQLRADYVGAFVVSAGEEVEKRALQFEKQNDDYKSLMIKAIGDRLAEASAEYAHWYMRQNMGFGKSEKLSNEELIAEKYRGIRPAPGYPACPDHSHKAQIWKLLDAYTNTGAKLTENFAIYPGSAVAGFYFFHPESKYFHVGQIDQDQLQILAAKRGQTVEQVKKWVASLSLD